jgi:hypothetical protein
MTKYHVVTNLPALQAFYQAQPTRLVEGRTENGGFVVFKRPKGYTPAVGELVLDPAWTQFRVDEILGHYNVRLLKQKPRSNYLRRGR